MSSIGNNVQEVLKSLRDGKSGVVHSNQYKELGFRSQVVGSIKIGIENHLDRRTRRFMGGGAAYATVAMRAVFRLQVHHQLISFDSS